MHVHRCLCPSEVGSGVDLTRPYRPIKRSGPRRLMHTAQLVRSTADRRRTKFSSAGSPQVFNRSSTGFPQRLE
jgi:hypothetical protein